MSFKSPNQKTGHLHFVPNNPPWTFVRAPWSSRQCTNRFDRGNRHNPQKDGANYRCFKSVMFATVLVSFFSGFRVSVGVFSRDFGLSCGSSMLSALVSPIFKMCWGRLRETSPDTSEPLNGTCPKKMVYPPSGMTVQLGFPRYPTPSTFKIHHFSQAPHPPKLPKSSFSRSKTQSSHPRHHVPKHGCQHKATYGFFNHKSNI